MKRLFLLLLVLLMLPLAALAAGKLNVTIDDAEVSYSFAMDSDYAVVQYRTATESGRMVVKGDNGHYEGKLTLNYSPNHGKVTVTVLDTALHEKMKETVQKYTNDGYIEPTGKGYARVTDFAVEPTLEGFRYRFRADGAQVMQIKASSRAQTMSMKITPDADGWFSGEVAMPLSYAYANIRVTVVSGSGKDSLATADTYRDYQHIDVVPQAEEGRLKGVIVCIDAGHQLHSMLSPEPMGPGLDGMSKAIGGMAQGTATGRKEHMVTLEVAYMLMNELHRQGATVLMTRTEVDQYVSNIDRDNVANDGNAHIMLRLHCDNNHTTSKYGISIHAPKNSDYAKALASKEEYTELGNIMLTDMRDAVHIPQTRYTGYVALTDGFVGNNWAKCICFLVEMGYMSNTSDDILMSVPAYQQQLAEGMCQGVYDIAVRRGWVTE